MASTFEKYPVGWYRNYSTRPTRDVEIIENQPLCDGRDWIPPVGESAPGNRGTFGPRCHKPIERKPDARTDGFDRWQHVDGSNSYRATPVSTCRYCGNNRPGTVHYRQRSYSDEIECDRCGGINGHGIGD